MQDVPPSADDGADTAIAAATTAALAGLSRELMLSVDLAGRVTWADARARRLGLTSGAALLEVMAPGCEAKARALLAEAAHGPVDAWELPIVAGGRPLTLLVSARRTGDRLALHGSLVAQAYADAIAEAGRAVHEIVELNRELMRRRRDLEEAHRGVLALHGELAQQADRLRASSEVKARLVAAVSHELRTPLHAILGLARLLLGEGDGPLAREQRTQVGLIHHAAAELARMIDDMLELSRLDAGAAPIRTEHLELADFLAALRGTMAPLVPAHGRVTLEFDPAADVPLETDPGKLAQILRNVIANALRFTERGVVRVRSRVDGDQLVVRVEDTGIGIPHADQARVFEEFVQLDGPLQRGGSGLGLPLSRRLAEALGGRLELESWPGVGTTVSVTVPLEHPQLAPYRRLERAAPRPAATPVLVVEDDRGVVFGYDRVLAPAGFQVIPARTTEAARALLARQRPAAIVLDVMLEAEDTWGLLAELKGAAETRGIPVVVCTVMHREERARALGADAFLAKPVSADALVRTLESLAAPGGGRVLVIDDDPAARYLVRKHLEGTPLRLSEAADATTGIAAARAERPGVIVLDYLLGASTALDVMAALDEDPRTRGIPVIVLTSHALDADARARLAGRARVVLSKARLSREVTLAHLRASLAT